VTMPIMKCQILPRSGLSIEQECLGKSIFGMWENLWSAPVAQLKEISQDYPRLEKQDKLDESDEVEPNPSTVRLPRKSHVSGSRIYGAGGFFVVSC